MRGVERGLYNTARLQRYFIYLVLFILLVSYDVENIWNDIDDVIIKTLISAHPILKHNYRLVYETLSQGFLAFIEIYRQQSS